MFRLMRQKRNYRYIDHLQDLVSSYNRSPHRSLNGLTSSNITKTNEVQVWVNMYLKPRKPKKTAPHFKFKIGDLVRISFTKHPFRRSYQDQYTIEVFKITNKFSHKEYRNIKLKI